jgi:hypothetical protein
MKKPIVLVICYTGKDVSTTSCWCTFGYVKYRFVKSGDENIEPE